VPTIKLVILPLEKIHKEKDAMPKDTFSLADYRAMFALTDADLKKPILDYAPHASSFDTEMSALGYKVVSCDGASSLTFSDNQFALALCSHYFFTQKSFDLDKNFSLVKKLCQVAEELRIFPLLNSEGQLSKYLGPLMLNLQQQDMGVEVRQVNYESQPGGNAMLRVWAQGCKL
jgi:hypothetical protein